MTAGRSRQAASALMLAGLLGCAVPGDPPHPAEPPALAKIARISGQGRPVVVLQSGLGEGLESWSALAPLLDAQHTVFRYDRPGRGQHPHTDALRDPCSIATEQRALLQRAGLKPPYILVGHSLGGLYQFAYARRYPDEVAGLVLLDPTHPQHWASLQREHPGLALLMQTVRATLFSAADRAEFDAQTVCLDRLPAASARPLPSKLLVSGQRSPEEAAMADTIKRLRTDWERLLGQVPQQAVNDAGHHIQQDRPGVVADAVRQLAIAPPASTPR